MTTIVATRVGNGVEFAYDSQSTWGSQAIVSDPKVFTRGVVTFGIAGSCRDGDVLQYALEIPHFRPKKDRAEPEKWIVTKLIPAIQGALDKAHRLEIKDNQALTDSHMIISVPGLLGMLSSDLSLVGQFDEFVGVGSGSQYALGALYSGATLENAVKVAAKLDVYTGGVVNTKEVKW